MENQASEDNTAETAYETYAAVDLGSNSFHMIVAREQEGQLHIVDRLREMVRLSAGLDAAKHLSEDAQTRALECLQRFGQRVLDIPQGKLRAVGTNTLRSAHNSREFLRKAEQALGHPIEIISGMEEARLIYLGVAHSLAADESKRLVVDIGGGSTEVIIGEGFAPMCMESLYMGCVSMTMRLFPDGKITSQAWKKAEIAALMELEPIITLFHQVGWEKAIGASGTIKAVRNVVQAMGWSENGISAEAMKKLVSALKKAGSFDKIKLSGLSEDRRPVFAGGVAVLNGVFKALQIKHMEVSDGALREGLLHDLLGRIHHQDVRSLSVAAVTKRFQLDLVQAARVDDTVKQLLNQVANDWQLNISDDGQWLSWAAQLHELGLSVAHSHHHKHGAYIVQNGDLSGFSQQEQAILAVIIRNHRRKFVKTQFETLPEKWQLRAQRLSILLRLGVLLHRSRSSTPIPDLQLKADDNTLTVGFPNGWLDQHSLTRADLEQEFSYLAASGFTLQIE
ncbi:MAG: exopolyphosphatase [Gammaproteobacteria bacterium SG8_11]|nr:MAG: exopolyphosphatase [Gammaproteobacteria bacterium SG8_11]